MSGSLQPQDGATADVVARFKAGMRCLASGVSIVAVRDTEGLKGFAATSVSSVAVEPVPTLLVCVNRAVSSHDALIRAGVFSVNLLAEDDAETARRFGSPNARHERFEDGQWADEVPGIPTYRRALASFGCVVTTSVVVGTHTVLFGHVLTIGQPSGAVWPLIYYGGDFASLHAA
jgi:flavin reductase